MAKILFPFRLSLLTYLLLPLLVSAQNNKNQWFGLVENKYDSVQQAQVYSTLDAWTINLSVHQCPLLMQKVLAESTDWIIDVEVVKNSPLSKDSIWRQKIWDKYLSLSDEYNQAYFRESIFDTMPPASSIQYYRSYTFRLLDFDADQKPDWMMIPYTYFGPSMGYRIFELDSSMEKPMLDFSGEFIAAFKVGEQSVLQFMVSIIENTECNILLTLGYENDEKRSFIAPKVYYAWQSIVPNNQNQLLQTQTAHTKQAAVIRTNQYIDDTSASPTDSTATLYGNVICKLKPKTEVVVLSKTKKWSFVAVHSQSGVEASSLRHGMDNGYFENDVYVDHPRVAPYYCGWIENKFLKQ